MNRFMAMRSYRMSSTTINGVPLGEINVLAPSFQPEILGEIHLRKNSFLREGIGRQLRMLRVRKDFRGNDSIFVILETARKLRSVRYRPFILDIITIVGIYMSHRSSEPRRRT